MGANIVEHSKMVRKEEVQLRSFNKEVKMAQKRIQKGENKVCHLYIITPIQIKDLEYARNKDKSEEIREREEKLEKLESQINGLKEEAANSAKEKEKVEMVRNQHESKGRELNDMIRAINESIRKAKRQMESLKRQQSDVMEFFPKKTRSLLNMIKKNLSKFDKPPIGPIGLLINVKDPEYCAAAEMHLKNHLRSYIWYVY